MYSSDHAPPHFHARYGEYEAQIAIDTGEPLAGYVPIRALRLVREWAELHETDYFRQVRVDPELGTVVWPNGYDLDPDVLHGDHQPVGRPAAQASR
jgi:hypothetical protein